MKTSESVAKVSAALVAVGAILRGVLKDKSTGRFGGYATLRSLITGISPSLTATKLCVIQGGRASMVPGELIVTTRIVHESGEWIETEIVMPPSSEAVKRDACHAHSAAYTYGRRVGLMAALNLYPTDDPSDIARDDEGHSADGLDPKGVFDNTANDPKKTTSLNKNKPKRKSRSLAQKIKDGMKATGTTEAEIAGMRDNGNSGEVILVALKEKAEKQGRS